MDQLVELLAGKNRIYTQLKPGRLEVDYEEAWLGQAQIFCESLNIGAHIQATPPKHLLPFAFILPSTTGATFCHQETKGGSIAKVGGEDWDVAFSGGFKYVCAAFDKSYFFQSYRDLTGADIEPHIKTSQLAQIVPTSSFAYGRLIIEAMSKIRQNKGLLAKADMMRLMTSQLANSIVQGLHHENNPPAGKVNLGKSSLAVKRVIDYLNVHARDLPDMPTLCSIAGVSERTLQYGFNQRLGVTPIQYLRYIRLNGARSELQKLTPKDSFVVDVATRWGFIELGRFSRDFKALFGELPSVILKRF